jgi:hypothetical protein
MDNVGVVSVVHGTPGLFIAPKPPALSILLAQVNIGKGWTRFVGVGCDDEVITVRSQHVIATRFDP